MSQFTAVSEADCPCTNQDKSGCRYLPKCVMSMKENDLCEADQKLPDGNDYYDVNNCPGNYDIFRKNEG